MIEAKRSEIIKTANQEAETLKQKTRQEIEAMTHEASEKLQAELKKNTQSFFSQLLTQIGDLHQQVVTLQADFEKQSLTFGQSLGLAEISPGSEKTEPSPLSKNEKTSKPEGKPSGPTNLLEDRLDGRDWIGEIELEVLPPVNIKKVMRIVNFLDNLPKVRTELIPLDIPIIVATLGEPLPLLEKLSLLPEIVKAEEKLDDGNRNGRRRILLTLVDEKGEARDRLNEMAGLQPSEPHAN